MTEHYKEMTITVVTRMFNNISKRIGFNVSNSYKAMS